MRGRRTESIYRELIPEADVAPLAANLAALFSRLGVDASVDTIRELLEDLRTPRGGWFRRAGGARFAGSGSTFVNLIPEATSSLIAASVRGCRSAGEAAGEVFTLHQFIAPLVGDSPEGRNTSRREVALFLAYGLRPEIAKWTTASPGQNYEAQVAQLLGKSRKSLLDIAIDQEVEDVWIYRYIDDADPALGYRGLITTSGKSIEELAEEFVEQLGPAERDRTPVVKLLIAIAHAWVTARSDTRTAGASLVERIKLIVASDGHSSEVADRVGIAAGAALGRATPVGFGRRIRGKNEFLLPSLPAGYSWPTGSYSTHKLPGEDIVGYLDRVWLPLINLGVVTLPLLRAVDNSAVVEIKSYTRPNPKTGERRQLPERLKIPTLKEANDQALLADPEGARRDVRLAHLAWRRARIRRRDPEPK